jgi:hypothetical protein
MKCERCGNDKEAEFRVISDILDMKVCADCAAEGRRLTPSLKIVKIEKANNEQGTSKAEVPAYPVAMPSQSTHWQSATMRQKNRLNGRRSRHQTRRGAA